MKNLVFISLLLFGFSANAFTDGILEKRLELREKISPKYCLKLAERKMQEGSKHPSAFYYAVKIKAEQAREAKTLNQQFALASVALSYARRYNKLAIKDSSALQSRQDLIEQLEKDSRDLVKKLKQANRAAKGERLLAKIGRLDYHKPYRKVPTKNEAESLDVEHPSQFIGGFYYGMPDGKEIIEPTSESKEKEILRLVNRDRKKKGLVELQMEPGLVRAARYHAYDMATQKYFSHQSYDRVDGQLVKVGSTFPRIRTFYNETFVNTENIAAGSAEAKHTYMQWYNSKGHYKNMFNASARRVGIGMYHNPKSPYKYYWVFCTAK